MRVLAIDSSGVVASVAIVEDGVMICEYTLNNKITHSQTLLPMIDEVIKLSETDKKDIDAIAVAGGPGSFTGLRIGSATAKGLGMVLDIPIVSIPTVDGLAYNLFGTDGLVCPIMDARRNQVYTGLYKFEKNDFVRVKEQCVVSIEEIIETINEIDSKVIFLGDGVPVYKKIIEEKIKVECLFAPSHLGRQRGGAIGELAYQTMTKTGYTYGKIESAANHVPDYLRLSQAERERMEKENVS